MSQKPEEVPALLHFKNFDEIPEKIECPACHGVFAQPHKHVLNSDCRHSLSENLIHDLRIIENIKKNAINQRLRSEKKKPSSQPATKAPSAGSGKMASSPKPATMAPSAGSGKTASSPKPANNNIGPAPPAPPPAASKKPPKEDPLDMLSRGQCPACGKKNLTRPLQHISSTKCKNNVSPQVIAEFQTLQKQKKKPSSKSASSGPVNRIYINNNQPPTAPAETEKPNEAQASSQQENPLEPQASSQQEIPLEPQASSQEENPLDMMIRGQCPACKKAFKSPVGHINKTDCKNQVSHEVILEFQAFQKKKRKAEFNANKRKADPSGVKEDQRKQKADSRTNQALWRKAMGSQWERLRKFREATKFPALFVCVSCHVKYFRNQVKEFSEKVKSSIKIDLSACIVDENQTMKAKVHTSKVAKNNTMTEEDKLCQTPFICNTCHLHLKKGKLPPKSVKNGLELLDTDEDLKDQGLDLNELEETLIGRNVVFEKIFFLPKSRWTALKGPVINVPISEDSLEKTLEALPLPRTPNEARLIGVTLKRKLEYKQSHQRKLIDSSKMFRMLDKLKAHNNVFYSDVVSPEQYEDRCKETDRDGYTLVFGSDEDQNVDEEEAQDQNIYIKNIYNINNPKKDAVPGDADPSSEDPGDDYIKKWQFEYDNSVAMSSKYPEMTFAPGQGYRPKGLLSDMDWETRAFPATVNADGSNGMHQEREVRLTPQQYAIQRLCQINTRFVRNQPYMYALLAYLEEKRLRQNISMVGLRGTESVSAEGKSSFQLEQNYRVFENLPNSITYWKNAKYEMLAKIDNFGAFQLFFTLSCADMRWDQNFAAVLAEKGYSVNFKSATDDDGQHTIYVEAKSKNGQWKPIKKFLEEEVEETLHTLIQGNVMAATRYFNHRVKAFMTNIVMDKSNPLSVKCYCWKVEFQQRGAAHIHGTIWVYLKKLEKTALVDGELCYFPQKQPGLEYPMKSLGTAFANIRHNIPQTDETLESLRNFVDSFVTVSTHGPTVGEDVAKIAREVNTHHHTKTCTKKGRTKCRFKYPKPPSPYTIIQKPIDKTDKEQKKMFEEATATINTVLDFIAEGTNIQTIMADFDKAAETKGTQHQEGKVQRIKAVCESAHVKYEDYIEALQHSNRGYAIVLARDIDECTVNPFNPEWLRAWNGNMDLQVVIDFYQVITYITDYYSKADDSIIEKLNLAVAESGSRSVKENMSVMANTFLTHRVIGEAEACYRLIPSLNLSMSNVTTTFINTNTDEEKSKRFRKATQEHIDAGVPVIEIDGHEGLWYETHDMMSKYVRRPDELKDISAGQFLRMYDTYSKKKIDEDQGDKDENEAPEENIHININKNSDPPEEAEAEAPDDDYNEEYQFNFVMTYLKEGTRGTPLPEIIELKEKNLNESAFMKKRQFPKAVRFHKPNRANEPERYMLNELMLYSPHYDDIDKSRIHELFTENYNGENKIRLVKNQVMPYLEGVEEARFYCEQMEKEEELEETGVMLDPQNEQDEEEAQEEMNEEDAGRFNIIDPNSVQPNEGEQPAGKFKHIDVPDDIHNLYSSAQKLDRWQREVLTMVIQYSRDVVKARSNGDKYPNPLFLMVHGGAGAGKSTVINEIACWVQKILLKPGDSLDCPYVAKTAFTGVAASNIDGQTLHSMFSFREDIKIENF